MKAIAIPILLGELCLLTFGQPWPGVTFCVKPSMLTNCSLSHECYNASECETLDYYLKNIDSTINMHKNITLYFLNGNYSGVEITIINPYYVKMIGESEDVQIWYMYVDFTKYKFHVQFERIAMMNWHMSISDLLMKLQFISVTMQSMYIEFDLMSNIVIQDSLVSETLLPVGGQNTSSLFSGCTLQFGTLSLSYANNVTVENCNLTNYKVFLLNSNIFFSGESQIAASNLSSAILSFSSTIVLSGNVEFINNTATNGGAMALYSSNLNITGGTRVSFINNTAFDVGGAIYIDPGHLMQTLFLLEGSMLSPCFYQIIECNDTNGVTIHFANNMAANGGGDIYGGSLNKNVCNAAGDVACPIAINGTTSVSSDPTRVCLCNNNNEPQCTLLSTSYKIYPGETFTVRAVVVGGDFGPTIGAVYAKFLPSTHFPLPSLNRQNQVISNNSCTKLYYSLYSNYTQNGLMMYLTTLYTDTIKNKPDDNCYNYSDVYCSHTTPVYFNISLLPCLPGFTILSEPPKCNCYPALSANGVQCKIINGTGYFSWNNSLWMNIKDSGVIYSKYCPFGYCNKSQGHINLQNNPDAQCSFNRAGLLCGGCRENYSLAIGSSHCIHVLPQQQQSGTPHFLCSCRTSAGVFRQCLQPHCHSGHD